MNVNPRNGRVVGEVKPRKRATLGADHELTEELWPIETVRRFLGYGTTNAINKMVVDGRFPAPLRIGIRAVRWKKSEIDRWLLDCERTR